MRLYMERSALASPSDSWVSSASTQTSAAFLGSFASRPFAFSTSCLSLDMEELRYRGLQGWTSRTRCPDGAYDPSSHPVGDLAPVIHRRDHQIGDAARRDLTPIIKTERGSGVDRHRDYDFGMTHPKLGHPEGHHEGQAHRR